jgi:nucleoid-associated protein YgaU
LTPPSFPTAVPTMTATLSPTATQLPFPSATPTATLTRLPESYVVQRDDWLIKIAIRLYGGRWGWEWRCLYERNRAVIGDNPHLIFRGQVLRGIRPCGGQGE